MNRHYKIFLAITFVILTLFAGKFYYERVTSEKIKTLSIRYEAESIANFLVAFRQTYQDIFIKNHTKLNEENIDFLPVKTTNEISHIFSKLSKQSKISTVSDRPRNPKNMANDRQLSVINLFKKDHNLTSFFKKVGTKYYYSQPLYITKKCLECHGKPEEAPSLIQKRYDKAYNYKIGELRGIIDIEVSQTKLSQLLEKKHENSAIFVSFFLLLLLAILLFYAYYNNRLSTLLEKNSLALEAANQNLQEKVAKEVMKNREKDEKLFQQSRLAQMGEMISMIAHQWRQPLGSISATVSNIELKMAMQKYDLKSEEGRLECEAFLKAKLENIMMYVQTLSTTIDDFRNFYNPNKSKNRADINRPIQKALTIIRDALEKDNISLVESYESHRTLAMYESEVMQVFLNILKNAQDNFKEKGMKNALIKITTKDIEKGVVVQIEDNGGGISDEIIGKIFDPYFSTKDSKNGTGLGLYMSKTIIEEHHHGSLSVKNSDEGAIFDIIFYEEDR